VAGIKKNFVKFCFSAQGTKETGQALDRLEVRICDQLSEVPGGSFLEVTYKNKSGCCSDFFYFNL
jgi:hypothetical protein